MKKDNDDEATGVNSMAPRAYTGRQPKRFWLIEVWDEIRPTLKALVADGAIFLVVLGIATLSKLVVLQSGLSTEKKTLLSDFHFYILFACLGVLGIALVLTIIRIAVRHRK